MTNDKAADYYLSHPIQEMSFPLLPNADGENRTRKAYATRPSSVRVYQFHHIRVITQYIKKLCSKGIGGKIFLTLFVSINR